MEPILQLGLGGAIVLGVLYLGWQTLKVVLDIRRHSQPITANGNAGKMIEIMVEQTNLMREMVVISKDHKYISLTNNEKLNKIDANLAVAMERQRTSCELVREIQKSIPRRSK